MLTKRDEKQCVIHDVMLSAYFVDIKHAKIVVLAKNIADADKTFLITVGNICLA